MNKNTQEFLLFLKTKIQAYLGPIVYSDALIRAFAQICGRPDVYRHGIVNLYDDSHRIMLRFDNTR